MPELPDVEKYKKYLDQNVLHKKITKVQTDDSRIIKAPKNSLKSLEGHEFKGSKRIGKYLFLETDNKKTIVMHFGMTGDIKYYDHGEQTPKNSRIIFAFNDHHDLAFVNPRKLGKLDITNSIEEYREKKELGEDALTLSEKDFINILDNKTGGIKAFLMDQKNLSGLGNVYTDEILFQARIHPSTKVNNISGKQKKDLYYKMMDVLQTAIKHDADPAKFPDHYLTAHRKNKDKCPDCEGEVEKVTVAGRSTYFCPSCQQE